MNAMGGISRRTLLQMGGLMGMGALATTALAACAPQKSADGAGALADTAGASVQDGPFAVPESMLQPEPITEFAETHDYDVVVVGAGLAGLSAVHTALEGGARVACVQNTAEMSTSGNMGGAIDLTTTSPAAVQACLSFLMEKSDYRSDRRLLNVWAQNSQEALAWWAEAAAAEGVESVPYESALHVHGYDVNLVANTYFHVKGSNNTAATAIKDGLAKQGAEFFFAMPAVQLRMEDGAVTGVICENESGEAVCFNASKGVILCTGDYSGNTPMREYLCPDLKGLNPSMESRDGSGLMMGIWAGAVMEPPCHAKMVHEGAKARVDVPFLNINQQGERFMCEGPMRTAYLNNFQRQLLADNGYENANAGRFFSILPGNWRQFAEEWIAEDPLAFSITGGAGDIQDSDLISAETIEDLVAAINAFKDEKKWDTPAIDAAAVKATVERYNELCAAGADDDFGKEARYLVPIDNGPYFAVARGGLSVPAILGGLIIAENGQCLNEDQQPIAGLFAAGNASGPFFGGVDYPLDVLGLSVGRAITTGYVTGAYVAAL